MSGHSSENEIKIRLDSSERFPDSLFQRGFQEATPRTLESNTLFDTVDNRLRTEGMLLRLRELDIGTGSESKALLTWKGRGEPGPHKNRPEAETLVDSAPVMRRILAELGFRPVFRYEKYRTEYRRGTVGVVTYDETPIGHFLELEGPADWIDQTAQELGFGPDRYVLESYGRLYLQECEARGKKPGDMLFAAAR